ncbi:hypothetical protein [Streptomyces sp. SAI-090]|uniref:hypothetical protein n=1 Tax=Streptomyces sp. SAI-090 TaxID=2940545 RepID=UPI0024763B6C|nr:hypothetical protein [Streptomyces sp. SAI-090]MDH6522318.1 hypothetical protein [Streptomyces sp. SAI-090]
MNTRRTLAVATATALLGGLGTYGAVTAFASSSDTSTRPASSASASASAKSDSKSTDAMIRQCLKHVPAGERKAMEKQMRSMMSDHKGMSDHNGMSDHSMMNGGSSTSMSGMMGTADSGS